MRVFVAYGYNDRDKWVKDLVFPIIKAFGDEVVTGEEIYDGPIPPAVVQRVAESQAMIGFLTRRQDQAGVLTNGTHWWVLQELGIAVARNMRLVPVREEGLDSQAGMTAGHQYITYRESERDKFLVEIVKALGVWHSSGTIRLQILPQECALQVKPFINKPGFRVRYRLLKDGDETELVDTRILPIHQGLFVDLRNVPLDALVQLQIDYAGQSWNSNYESMDSVGIHLTKE